MAYVKHEWECGDILTPELMNHIEEGIEEASQSGGGGSSPKFVVLSGTVENVNNGSTGSASYTAAQLAELGISNVDNIAVVSVKQYNPVDGGYTYTVPFGTTMSGMTTYHNNYPMVFLTSGSLRITVFNGREGTGSTNIPYEVVLMDTSTIA